MEYKIGKIKMNDNGPQKFVLVLDGESFVFYAASSYWGMFTHRHIAESFELDANHISRGGKIVGGGSCTTRDGILDIYDHSGSYGGIPSEVMEKFREPLMTAYGVRDVEINLDPRFDKTQWRDIARKLGLELKLE